MLIEILHTYEEMPFIPIHVQEAVPSGKLLRCRRHEDFPRSHLSHAGNDVTQPQVLQRTQNL